MKDDVPNLKDYSSRLREEANMDLADIKADGEISEPCLLYTSPSPRDE